MIFARYTGTDKRFTTGKVYPAKPEIESSDAVGYGFIEVVDDAGENVQVKRRAEMVPQEDGRAIWDFEFLEEVYAVVVKPFEDFQVGQVVVVDDAEAFSGDQNDGGRWSRLVYSIKGLGYRSSDCLVLLDRTNVFPGLMILDENTGCWEKVKIVDECLWVVVDGQKDRRAPEEFRFAVDREGDIMVEPMVECVDASGQPGLSKGTRYYVVREEKEGNQRLLVVVNDAGLATRYMADRFQV